MIICGIITKVNKDKVNKKLLRIAKVIKAIRSKINKEKPHTCVSGKGFPPKIHVRTRKEESRHQTSPYPCACCCWKQLPQCLSLSAGLANRVTDCLCISYLFKYACVVNSLGKERSFPPLEQREILLANFLPSIKDYGSLSCGSSL